MIDSEIQGAVDVLTPRGPLNEECREELLETVAGVAPGAIPQVVLSLSEVPLVDGRGLETMLDARDEVRRRGGTIKFATPTVLVNDVLHATGVGEYFEVFEDLRAAVGSFAR